MGGEVVSVVSIKVAMLVLLAWAAPKSDAPALVQARDLYNHTEYQQSLKVLDGIAVKDAAAWALIGRNHYMEGDFKKAAESLEKAAVADPGNAEYALWLGRAFGRRAETSSPFTAPGLAGKARQYFERAVQLNPKYLEALNDLFEYYLDAPGFLGGGSDKASAIAARIAAIDPSEGHWANAKLAEKHKQFAGAEEQLRRAIASSPHQVGRVIDLARFLARRGRIQEADQSFARAEAIEPNSPSLMYARAETYIETKRKLDVAKDLLKRYLSSPLTPDDPPRSDAVKLLRQVEGD
jgi:Flp pilus assembly protein TadD